MSKSLFNLKILKQKFRKIKELTGKFNNLNQKRLNS